LPIPPLAFVVFAPGTAFPTAAATFLRIPFISTSLSLLFLQIQ